MPDRPDNWVSREQQARALPQGQLVDEPPDLDPEFLTWAEKQFPPRCYTADEPLEAHLQYAGVVSFLARLRRTHDEREEAKRQPTGENEWNSDALDMED